MERSDEFRELIDAFKSYRDMLMPLKEGLTEFAETYEGTRASLQKINNAFDGDISAKLSSILNSLQAQSGKASDLTAKIDSFVNITNRYAVELDKMGELFEKAEKRFQDISAIENKVEALLEKIEAIGEEKRKSYNIQQLQRSFESYNSNLQGINEFINKDVVNMLQENSKKIDQVKQGADNIEDRLKSDGNNLESLVNAYIQTNQFLKKITEQNDVNESYLFDVLDRWAETRRVKIKK